MRTIEDIFRQIESVADFSGHQIDSVHYRNGYDDTPLHIVANWGDIEAIKLLVNAGADVNAIGETGFTPLHCAAEQNWPEAVELLLALGATQIPDKDGCLPYELAKMLGNSESLKVLENAI